MAVTVADPFVVIVPAVAVNVAVVAAAGTVTDAGTVSNALLLESVVTIPPAGAAWLRVTVHVEEPPVLSDDGLQFTLLRLTAAATVTLPPVADVLRPVPLADEADTLVTLIGIVPDAPAASVTLTAAIVPFWMTLAFRPLTIHVRVPLPLEQLIVLEAAVAALPAEALMLAKFDAL